MILVFHSINSCPSFKNPAQPAQPGPSSLPCQAALGNSCQPQTDQQPPSPFCEFLHPGAAHQQSSCSLYWNGIVNIPCLDVWPGKISPLYLVFFNPTPTIYLAKVLLRTISQSERILRFSYDLFNSPAPMYPVEPEWAVIYCTYWKLPQKP